MSIKYFPKPKNFFTYTLLLLCLVLILSCVKEEKKKKSGKKVRPSPVEVSSIERGPITLFRSFNGSLEPQAEFVVSPKIGGRVERLTVNLADTVTRGQVVAELDDDEYLLEVTQARANLAVAAANLEEAKTTLTIATRELERVKILKIRGVASETQLDTIMAEMAVKKAGLEVAKAHVTRAEALLKTANIRLGYTKVIANWHGGDDQRVVAKRFIEEGSTVSSNTSLLLIAELSPIKGIIFVTEKDYAKIHTGQTARLKTDTYPDDIFEGRIDRISPVFLKESRQARVEITLENPGSRLKPGMFIRTTVKLESIAEATIIPDAALTSRDNQDGIFLVNEKKMTVSWHPVKVGIRQGNIVQIKDSELTGKVVSLGHQLIEDGSTIIIATTRPKEKTKNKPL